MQRNIIKASYLIEQLKILIDSHGDLPVMVAIQDVGTYDISEPVFDTDDGEDDCFIV